MITLKTFIPALGLVLLATTGCQQAAKTSSEAPDSTASKIETPSTDSAKTNQDDATSKIRRDQLNSDIRAREQRNNATNKGQAINRSDNDIASEVRSKLEANLPASALAVTAKDGAVMVTGTVPTQAQFARIDGLVKDIKGVTAVSMKVAVAPAKAN
ncbi:BON domain-containing protein [Chamaesiphon sp. VAR_48_metabat_135_sub]|uniref:BON domain-containing protein n=1 Tax=Chamaesiphon sp. VAR_48_metabat_135_sub TaxID=2964699 RepID=UPI00286CB5B6|nr:BON domain-containing protein [Chamaesiphon sp. VAR_48_metabat_135_sub]